MRVKTPCSKGHTLCSGIALPSPFSDSFIPMVLKHWFPWFPSTPKPRSHRTNNCTAPVVWKVLIWFPSALHEVGEGEVTLILIGETDKQLLRGINWLVWGPTIRYSEVFLDTCSVLSHHTTGFQKPVVVLFFFFPFLPLETFVQTKSYPEAWTNKTEKKAELLCLKQGRETRNTDMGSLFFLRGTARTLGNYSAHLLIHSENKFIELWLIFLLLL